MREHALPFAVAVFTAVAGFPQSDEWKQRMAEGSAAETAGDYVKAAAAFRGAAEIADRLEQPARRIVAWNSVGSMYDAQARFTDAESAYRRALKAAEQPGGKPGSDSAVVMGNLATMYVETGQNARGEKLMREALAIQSAIDPPNELRLAIARNALADILATSRKYQEAERMLTSSLAYLEKRADDWGLTSGALDALGVVRFAQGNPGEAERLFRRSLATVEAHLGPDHPMLARTLHNLAVLLGHARRREEAFEFLRRALDIGEKRLGAEHPLYGIILAEYASYLRDVGEKSRAKEVQARSNQILKECGHRNGIGAVIDVAALQRK